MTDNQRRAAAILARVELAIRAQWRANQPNAGVRLAAVRGLQTACVNDPALCDVLLLAFDAVSQPLDTEPPNP